jgi:hypothetical protein
MNQTGNVRDGLGYEANSLHHHFEVRLVCSSPDAASMAWRYRGKTTRIRPPVYRWSLSPGRNIPMEQENLYD